MSTSAEYRTEIHRIANSHGAYRYRICDSTSQQVLAEGEAPDATTAAALAEHKLHELRCETEPSAA